MKRIRSVENNVQCGEMFDHKFPSNCVPARSEDFVKKDCPGRGVFERKG